MPTVQPTTVSTASQTSANFVVELGGISSDSFDSDAQASFRAVVSNNAGAVCGTSGARACTSTDVTINSYARRSISIDYSLQVSSSAAANSASTTLQAYMSSDAFGADLEAQGGGLLNVSSVTIISSTITSNGSSDDGLSDTTIIIIAVIVFQGVLVIVLLVVLVVRLRRKQQHEDLGKQVGSSRSCDTRVFAPLTLGSTMPGDTLGDKSDDHADSDQVDIDMGRDIRTSYDAPLDAAPLGYINNTDGCPDMKWDDKQT